MNEQSPFLVAPYAALAGVYEAAGFADYTRNTVLSYVNHAQTLDFAGRRIIDLGCGTGVASWLLAARGFRVTGVDSSPHMIAQAEAREQDQGADEPSTLEGPDFVHEDMRTLDIPAGTVDMVLALDGVFNLLLSPGDVQRMFSRVADWLGPERFFIFDVWTITGLARLWGTGDRVIYDNHADLLVLARHDFSYEALAVTTRYTILQRGPDGWTRHDEVHKTRSFPLQGIARTLERSGFEVLALVTPELQPFDVENDAYGRAVFMARRANA